LGIDGKKNLTLITASESEDSEFTEEEAQEFLKKDEIPLDNKQTASTTESKDNTPLADKEETAESLFDMIE